MESSIGLGWEDGCQHDNGGPYGDLEEKTEGTDSTTWMKWWVEEQQRLVVTLVDKLMANPNPRRAKEKEPHHFKMTKMTKDDDPEEFINSSERMAITAAWPKNQWAAILTLYLSGAAQTAVDTLPVMEAQDYKVLRHTIMSTLNMKHTGNG